MRSPNEQQLPQLFAPLMGRAQTSGSNSGSSGGDTHSPLPPSASRSGLYGSSENDINTSLDLEADTPPKPINSPSKPTVSISWSSAISHALPITLMNTAQVLSQAQLVTSAPRSMRGVAAMHHARFNRGAARVSFARRQSRSTRLRRPTSRSAYSINCSRDRLCVRDIPDADKAVTSLFALAAVTLLQGVCYLTLGSLRASELVQYLPYPVVCGLLGVTALGICHAGIGVASLHVLRGHARLETSMQDLSAAWESRPAQLLATFAFALSHMGISHLTNSGTAFLLVVPAALLLFYGGLNFNPMREAELVEKAWLFERSNKYESLLDVWWTSRDFSRVWWRYTLPDKVATSMRCIVSLMALVLKVIAVEASANIAVDLDSELRAAGAANLACAALGGCLANHSALYVGPLRRALGAASDRSVLRVPMVTLVFTAAVLAAGGVSSLMDRAPRFIIGGMLLALGLQMCVDWVWNSRKRMDRVGYALLIAIMLIALSGLPTHALFLGLLAAVASSHRRLSKLSALRYHLTGASAHAAVSRVTHAQYFLERHGHAIHLLGLEDSSSRDQPPGSSATCSQPSGISSTSAPTYAIPRAGHVVVPRRRAFRVCSPRASCSYAIRPPGSAHTREPTAIATTPCLSHIRYYPSRPHWRHVSLRSLLQRRRSSRASHEWAASWESAAAPPLQTSSPPELSPLVAPYNL